jgi:hypothetical protein
MLFAHDPMGLNYEHNTDEYSPEAETIVLRRPEARTFEDLPRIVHEEFARWFGDDTVGLASRYEQIARDLWSGWDWRESWPVRSTRRSRVDAAGPDRGRPLAG